MLCVCETCFLPEIEHNLSLQIVMQNKTHNLTKKQVVLSS